MKMNNIEMIEGGVCAAKGFKASGIHCGLKKVKNDLALIISEERAAAACVYTQNKVKGAPITVTRDHVSDGYATAVICNSGNANTCNENGVEIAEEMCELVSKHTGIPANDVIVASTGVIGKPLYIEPIENGMTSLIENLKDSDEDCIKGIMTTDTVEKRVAVSFEIDGKICRMGGIAKGSGMIHPNMATMLVFITTDVCIHPSKLRKALSANVESTFNMISVDGDTSTNDMVSVLANGLAGNDIINAENSDYETFCEALNTVMTYLCRAIAKDGEGATKLLECRVFGASSIEIARKCAKSVICSNLVKAAMFGADANWGRVLCALGYSGANIDVGKIDVAFMSSKGMVKVCEKGSGINFSEEIAKLILSEDEIIIDVCLNVGYCEATAWGCDLTYDYVKINGDYRT